MKPTLEKHPKTEPGAQTLGLFSWARSSCQALLCSGIPSKAPSQPPKDDHGETAPRLQAGHPGQLEPRGICLSHPTWARPRLWCG